jgi:hypothetical protein
MHPFKQTFEDVERGVSEKSLPVKLEQSSHGLLMEGFFVDFAFGDSLQIKSPEPSKLIFLHDKKQLAVFQTAKREEMPAHILKLIEAIAEEGKIPEPVAPRR